MIPRLYRFALHRLDGDEELARDIVQTTLCKVLRRLDTYRAEAALLTWLCGCCRNEILMHFRRSNSRPAEVTLEVDEVDLGSAASASLRDGESPSRALMRRESAALVHETLDRLPERYAQALEWKYLEDLSVKQIAWRLKASEKAAESLLTRARDAFRTAWAERTLAPPTASSPPTAAALEAAGSPS